MDASCRLGDAAIFGYGDEKLNAIQYHGVRSLILSNIAKLIHLPARQISGFNEITCRVFLSNF
jgi:hypothetical protein